MKVALLLAALVLGNAAAAETLAVVGDVEITTADVVDAAGKMPTGDDLKNVVNGLIDRALLLKLAEGKGLTVTTADVDRAAVLSRRAFGANAATGEAAYRKYLRQELTITKYIDLYIYPRIDPTDANLRAFFGAHGLEWLKTMPAEGPARAALFARDRNEVWYRYVGSEMNRLLAADVAAARERVKVATNN